MKFSLFFHDARLGEWYFNPLIEVGPIEFCADRSGVLLTWERNRRWRVWGWIKGSGFHHSKGTRHDF